MVACNVTVPPPGATGPSGPSGTTPTGTPPGDEEEDPAAAACEGSTSSCGKFVTKCKTECKDLSTAAERKTCTTGCNEALDGCVEACKDSDDPESFDAEDEDFPGKPEDKPTTSDECGGVDQLACAEDSGFDPCQEDNLEVPGADENGEEVTFCRASCAKNILETTDGKDDCDATHVCFPTDFNNANAPTACVPSECDPATATTDGFSVSPGCAYPFARCGAWAKPAFGFCNFNCTPHDEDNACPAGQECIATYTTVTEGNQQLLMQVNLCSANAASATKTQGQECTITITGDTTAGLKATDNCANGLLCNPNGPSGAVQGSGRTCAKNCGTFDGDPADGTYGPTGDPTACAGVAGTTCKATLSDIATLPYPSNPQLPKQIADGQGEMYMCRP